MRVLDFLYSDDIFISYSRKDGVLYATGIADKLTERKLSCFLDRLDTQPGYDLPESFKRKIRSCKVFVLIGTPEAAKSEFVAKEIAEFNRTGRTILPVDFAGAVSNADWYQLIPGLPTETENAPGALKTGEPSLNVIAFIEKSFNYTRRNQRMLRMFWGLLSFFLVLVGFSLAAFFIAQSQISKAAEAVQVATEQTRLADEARREAQRQKGIAEGQTVKADQAAQDANKMTLVAEEAKSVADAASAEATKMTLLADAARRREKEAESSLAVVQTEVSAQRKVAQALTLANRAEFLREKVPDQLPISLLLAAEALRRAPILEADQALRRGLALTPQVVGKVPYHGAVAPNATNPLKIFSPDGKYLITTDYSKVDELLVWKATGVNVEPVARLNSRHWITSFAFDPEGKYLITTGLDRVVRVWEKWQTREPIAVTALLHHDQWLGNVAVSQNKRWLRDVIVSPKGKYLAVLDSEGAAHVWENWNSLGARRIMSLPSPEKFSYPNQRVAFSGDESRLIMQIRTYIVVFDLVTGQRISGPTTAMMTHDRRFLISVADNNELSISAIADGRERARLKCMNVETDMRSIRVMDYNDATHYLVMGERGYISVRNTKDGHVLMKLPQKSYSAHSASMSPDGKFLAVIENSSKVINIWRVTEDAQDVTARLVSDEQIMMAVFSPDSRSIVMLGAKSARVWALTGYSEDRSLAVEGNVSSLAVSPDGDYIAAVAAFSLDSNIYILSASTGGKVISPFEFKPGYLGYSGLTFSRDGKYLAATGDGKAHVYTDWRTTPRMVGSVDTVEYSKKIAFSPDGEYLAVADANSVAVWNRKDWGEPQSKPIHFPCDRQIEDFIFSPDGRLLVVSCYMGKVLLWEDWQSDHPRVALSFFTNEADKDEYWREYIRHLAFSPDGKRLAGATGDHIYVWEGWSETATLKLVSRINGSGIGRITFSPDGGYIAGDNNHGGSIWEILTGSEMARIAEGGIGAFSHDGKYLINSRGLWLWRQSDMLRKACEYISERGTSLSEDEWRRYVGGEVTPQTCPPTPSGRP